MPSSGPRSRGARAHPRPRQGVQPCLRASAASGLVLATQNKARITGRGTRLAAAVGDVKGEVREQPEGRVDPERELRRRTALAQIRQFGDPALRLRAHEVSEFDGDLVRLVERMKALMADANGVGLAANQVGILRRVVVVQPDSEQEALALVNPRLVDTSDERETDDEGCLSLQG